MLGSSQSEVMLLLVPLTFDLNYWAVNKFDTGMIVVFSNWIVSNDSQAAPVVRFEDLKTDLIGQIKRMQAFFNV